jgi:class 3 adenylate cyclase
MSETRKIAAILVADVVGYSRLAGADEDRTLSRLRGLRSDLIDPAIAAHHGRIVKRTGDGILVEFRSVVDAVRCAIEVQNGTVERNAGVAFDKRIEFRIGIHLGDVVEESDGDLMGDGVNIAARLERIAAPGSICLSEDAYRQVRDKLREEFVDLGDHSLKNIARPVRVHAIKAGALGSTLPAHSSTPESPRPPRLSIVVLPFANIGDNVDQEYFVDGVTESLTTDLSRMPGMIVIGRNTAFAYKGKSGDLKQIGRELNIRYVLEGSVQRGGNRMRVNVQLIDAETANHVWAERSTSLWLTFSICRTRLSPGSPIRSTHSSSRRKRGARSARPVRTLWTIIFKAWRCSTRDLLRTICREPKIISRGRCHSMQATWRRLSALHGRIASSPTSTPRTIASLAWRPEKHSQPKPLPSRLSIRWGTLCLGLTYVFNYRATQGIAQCERALALDRNLAVAHAYIGMAKWFVGHGEETQGHIDEAFRLSPRDTLAYFWKALAGIARIFLGQYEEAVASLRQSTEINGNFALHHIYLAVALAELGQLEEARIAAQNGLAIDPRFTILRYRNSAPSDNPTFLKARERNYVAMRNAGVARGMSETGKPALSPRQRLTAIDFTPVLTHFLEFAGLMALIGGLRATSGAARPQTPTTGEWLFVDL